MDTVNGRVSGNEDPGGFDFIYIILFPVIQFRILFSSIVRFFNLAVIIKF